MPGGRCGPGLSSLRPAPPKVGGGLLTRIPPGLGCWTEGPCGRSLQRGNVTLKKAWLGKGGLPGAYGALLDASWVALGAEKRSLERLLAAPRGIPRQVSAILGAKRLPKGRPRGSKIESKRRLELKMRILQKAMFLNRIHCFLRSRGRFGGVKIDIKWHRMAACSWRLLEPKKSSLEAS